MQYRLSYQNKIFNIDIREEKDGLAVTVGDNTFQLEDCRLQDCVMDYRLADRVMQIYFIQDKDDYHVASNGEYYVIRKAEVTAHDTKGATAVETNSIVSSMPGLLVKAAVKVGDKVKSGDTLVIVEAMKMQNELRAPRDGIVKSINFKEGEQVDAFQPIVELKPQ